MKHIISANIIREANRINVWEIVIFDDVTDVIKREVKHEVIKVKR